MNRQRKREPWPIPTDRTALDRSRTLARSLLAALAKADPAAAEQHVQLARTFGEHWLAATPDVVAGTRLLTTDEAAAIVGRRPSTIRAWASRGDGTGRTLTRHPGGYVEQEVIEYAASLARTRPTHQEAPA